MSMDLDILDILLNCDYPRSSYPHFADMSLSQLQGMPLVDLVSLLRKSLPPSPTRPLLIDKFISRLSNHQESAQDLPNPDPFIVPPIHIKQEVKVKQEVADSSTSSPPPPAADQQENDTVQQEHAVGGGADPSQREPEDSDSDVEIVDEVMNVAIIRVLDAETKTKESTLHVTIHDDEDETTILAAENDKSSASRKRKADETSSPSTSGSSNPAKIMKKSFQLGRSPAECKGTTQSVHWTMAEFQNMISPSKSIMGELSIVSNCNVDYISSYLLNDCCNNASFPNLTTLKIRHHGDACLASRDVNYSAQLGLILAKSPALDRIEVNYDDKTALKSLLRAFGWVSALSSLSSLIIRPQDKSLALAASSLTALSQITAPNLEELNLICCIMAKGDGTEVKTAFENMLQRFPKLTKFKIDGCFVTPSSATINKPKIMLNFPKLVHLQALHLGFGCLRYSFDLETAEKLPKRKKRKTLAINLDLDQRPVIGNGEPTAQNYVDASIAIAYIPVSINFHGTMPCLKSISVGALFNFQSLYFSELQELKVFKVASGWAQSYPAYFPTGRKHGREENPLQTSKVRNIQFPDSFQDCFLISRITPHFPHLTHIRLKFPTVRFLRAFAKTMTTTGSESFQHLVIQTQFDFASSLDSCVLDEIAKPSAVELDQFKILKTYPHWEDYVKENHIQLPKEDREELEEDPNKFCGLRVLFKNLKTFQILHTPRTLRLPKGPRHWIDHPQPEFTNTLIGFKVYPFSKAVEAACPPTVKIITWGFDMSQVSKDFNCEPLRFEKSGPEVLFEPDAPSVKKEVKVEIK